MSGEGVLQNHGSWVEEISAERKSPELTWRAVRAAIWEAGKTGGVTQDHVKHVFYELKEPTLAAAETKLQESAKLFGGMRSQSSMGRRPVDYQQVSAGIEKAAEVLRREMGVESQRSR